MPKRLIDISARAPLLNIASYARRGLGRRDRLSPAEVQQIAQTVRRTPEVMVKVLSRGGQNLGAVRRHLDYLRLRDDGELELETDDSREWRWEFARHLRALGVAANATERAVRGESRASKPDGIYRAERRGESARDRERAEEVASELRLGDLRTDTSKGTLLETRSQVQRGWRAVSDIMLAEGHVEIAGQVSRFVEQLPPPVTERELIANQLLGRRPPPPAKEYGLMR